MANITDEYTLIPASADVSYKPLGGAVGIVSIHSAEIESLKNARAVTAIEAGYGEAGDGAELDHCRRRNLGLI